MVNKEAIYQIISGYFQDKSVKKAFVFGSYVKNSENENSDIDILIELSQSVGLMKIIEYKLDLEDLLHLKVDLLTPGSISPKIFPLIQKDLKLIYERG
jgi:predicted nucleotidyltransferase